MCFCSFSPSACSWIRGLHAESTPERRMVNHSFSQCIYFFFFGFRNKTSDVLFVTAPCFHLNADWLRGQWKRIPCSRTTLDIPVGYFKGFLFFFSSSVQRFCTAGSSSKLPQPKQTDSNINGCYVSYQRGNKGKNSRTCICILPWDQGTRWPVLLWMSSWSLHCARLHINRMWSLMELI